VPADVLILTSRPEWAAIWRSALSERGYDVIVEPWQADDWLARPDAATALLVILDPPDVKNVELAAIGGLKSRGSPVSLVIVGKGDVESRVSALNAGADACLVAGVGIAEMAARLTALLRRVPTSPRGITFSEGDLSLDLHTRSATYRGRQLAISQYEFRILRDLALQVMEYRSISAAAMGDDRLSEALHDLDHYAAGLGSNEPAGATPQEGTHRTSQHGRAPSAGPEPPTGAELSS
jgi:DNA-binding response OmpR family regulator